MRGTVAMPQATGHPALANEYCAERHAPDAARCVRSVRTVHGRSFKKSRFRKKGGSQDVPPSTEPERSRNSAFLAGVSIEGVWQHPTINMKSRPGRLNFEGDENLKHFCF